MSDFRARPPLLAPAEWHFYDPYTKSTSKVVAETWLLARGLAAMELGVPPETLQCTHNPILHGGCA